jgi:hypothetical protein
MGTAAEERNKAFVLEAFDTLANRRDYAAAQRFGRLTTSSTARTSRRAETACSTWSRPHRRTGATRTR